MRILKYLYITAAAVVLAACGELDISGMFSSPCERVDTRFEQSLKYNEQHKADTLVLAPNDDYHIHVCSDIHVNEGENINFPKFLKCAYADPKTALLVLDGDLTNYKGGLYQCKDTLDKYANETAVKCVAGNHDLYYDQWKDFYKIYGSSSYYFVVKTPSYIDLYVCLDSGSGTLGLKQMKWLKELLLKKNGQYRHVTIFTHCNMWDTDMTQVPSANFTIEETATLTHLFSSHKAEYVIMGHDHYREVVHLGGVTYITLDGIKDGIEKPSHLLYKVSNKIDIEFIEHIY